MMRMIWLSAANMKAVTTLWAGSILRLYTKMKSFKSTANITLFRKLTNNKTFVMKIEILLLKMPNIVMLSAMQELRLKEIVKNGFKRST